jgi:hypothetical protein
VKLHIEERLGKVFLPDSYGYRPRRSAHDAVGITRQENRNRFDFLGFEFQVRGSKCSASGRLFNNFLPAVSSDALKRIKYKIKWEWNLRRPSDLTLERIAEFYNPVIRGWFNYYGKFYASRIRRGLTEIAWRI